jgi:hypothetical protein
MNGVVLRVAVGLVALAALAWLVVMERDQRLLTSGTALTAKAKTPGAAAQAESDLEAARLLNPDPRPDQIRALLLTAQNRPKQSVALALRVARDEPDNLQAWNQVLQVSKGNDPAVAREAFRQLVRLDPVSARLAQRR